MHKLKPKNKSKSEQGSALVYTLMVLLLLSILGISVGMVTVGSYKLSDSSRDYTSAYYIAEAGANVAYEEIQNLVNNEYKSNPNNPMMKSDPLNYILKSDRAWSVSANGDSIAKKAYGKEYNIFEGQFGSATNATVAVKALTQDNATEFVIESVGSVDQKERVVQKKFEIAWPEDKSSGGGIKLPPTNAALVADNEIKLIGNGLVGDVYTNSTTNASVIFEGNGDWKQATIYHSSLISKESLLSYLEWFKPNLPKTKTTDEMIDFDYYRQLLEEVTLPQNVDGKILKSDLFGPDNSYEVRGNGSVIINGHGNSIKMNINKDSYIPEFNIYSYRNVTLDIGDTDKIILMDKFSLAGIIEIKGTGNLTIYITDNFNFSGGSINLKGQIDKVTFVYLGKEDLNFGGDAKVNGHIIAKNEGVIRSSVPFNGVILAGGTNITLQGGANNEGLLLIAPNAKVSMSGGYNMNGTVVSKDFEISGGSWLRYKEINTDGFPFGGSGGSTEPDKELVTSEPATEPN